MCVLYINATNLKKKCMKIDIVVVNLAGASQNASDVGADCSIEIFCFRTFKPLARFDKPSNWLGNIISALGNTCKQKVSLWLIIMSLKCDVNWPCVSSRPLCSNTPICRHNWKCFEGFHTIHACASFCTIVCIYEKFFPSICRLFGHIINTGIVVLLAVWKSKELFDCCKHVTHEHQRVIGHTLKLLICRIQEDL